MLFSVLHCILAYLHVCMYSIHVELQTCKHVLHCILGNAVFYAALHTCIHVALHTCMYAFHCWKCSILCCIAYLYCTLAYWCVLHCKLANALFRLCCIAFRSFAQLSPWKPQHSSFSSFAACYVRFSTYYTPWQFSTIRYYTSALATLRACGNGVIKMVMNNEQYLDQHLDSWSKSR